MGRSAGPRQLENLKLLQSPACMAWDRHFMVRVRVRLWLRLGGNLKNRSTCQYDRDSPAQDSDVPTAGVFRLQVTSIMMLIIFNSNICYIVTVQNGPVPKLLRIVETRINLYYVPSLSRCTLKCTIIIMFTSAKLLPVLAVHCQVTKKRHIVNNL